MLFSAIVSIAKKSLYYRKNDDIQINSDVAFYVMHSELIVDESTQDQIHEFGKGTFAATSLFNIQTKPRDFAKPHFCPPNSKFTEKQPTKSDEKYKVDVHIHFWWDCRLVLALKAYKGIGHRRRTNGPRAPSNGERKGRNSLEFQLNPAFKPRQ
eukprot:269848-Amphidinium_carterae.1